jgi:hypothetical protein
LKLAAGSRCVEFLRRPDGTTFKEIGHIPPLEGDAYWRDVNTPTIMATD